MKQASDPVGRHPSARRQALRDQLWPDAGAAFWSRKLNKGFTTIPRLLPLVMVLIRRLSGKLDPSSVYLELWARVFDEGLVSITNERDLAFAAGYTGKRAERTMAERLRCLENLGFIRIKADGVRQFAHILILNPLQVCVDKHAERAGHDDVWWTAFVRRANEVGAELPGVSSALGPTTPPLKNKKKRSNTVI